MNIIKLLTFFLVLFFTATGIADVEDILQAQKELNEDQKHQLTDKSAPPTLSAIELGKKEFEATCAMCHGIDGKGQGTFSTHLAYKPTDLTQIKKSNGGIFPAITVYETIDGRSGSGVHGSRTMPIWGDRYEADSWLDVHPKFADTIARGKILELILYINTLQE